jgi:uncharacterized protein with FMN-binding domain
VKRVVAAVLGTVAALVALLQFKTHGTSVTAAGGLPAARLPSDIGSVPAPGPTRSAPATTPPAAPSTRPPSTVASSTGAGSGTKTVAGDAIDTQYGTVQVQLTLSGSRVTNVTFLQLQAFDRRSQEINSYAAPILLQETLQAQSAQVDAVSGATYTSEGYVQSVQSALDKAGVR